MAAKSSKRNQILILIFSSALVALALYLFDHFFGVRMEKGAPHADVWKIPAVILWALLAYLGVRLLNAALFDFAFRVRRGYEAPTLVRNIFTLVVFTALFVVIFKSFYEEVNLGALFTTSAIFGVIIGLALQDTLGNFFSGISLHADRPFQTGDVIVVGQQKHTGVVEGITWRAIKIRTFQNHVVLVSNSNAAKEAIEVCPRDNLNARIVFFGTLYTDSPAKTIHVVREAVRDADNVSSKITPIVRIRNLAESSIDWEIKYWLEDYAKYNDTDALVRQRIWYALRRSGLTFAYPTRTIQLERKVAPKPVTADEQIADRLSAVDIFSPLSTDSSLRGRLIPEPPPRFGQDRGAGGRAGRRRDRRACSAAPGRPTSCDVAMDRRRGRTARLRCRRGRCPVGTSCRPSRRGRSPGTRMSM